MRKNLYLLLLFVGLALSDGVTTQVFAQVLKADETLHDRAKKAGGKFLWVYKPKRNVIYANVQELAKRSDVIVVGRTTGHRARLRSDGKFITKDFLVKVHEVIKGDITMGRSIFVSLPGGAYRFPDGTYAYVTPINYRQAEDGGIYVFFLKNKGSVYQGHEPVSESQGLFELTGGKVQSADLIKDDPVVAKYEEMSAAAFLAEIHKAVPRAKK